MSEDRLPDTLSEEYLAKLTEGAWAGQTKPYEVLTLIAAVRSLQEKAKWQPIETAPKDKTVVLTFTDSEGRHAIFPAYYWESYSRWLQIEGPFAAPTHWMPLPEPPEVSGE